MSDFQFPKTTIDESSMRFWLESGHYSPELLKKIQIVVSVISNAFSLQNDQWQNPKISIPLRKFVSKGVSEDEVFSILNKINDFTEFNAVNSYKIMDDDDNNPILIIDACDNSEWDDEEERYSSITMNNLTTLRTLLQKLVSENDSKNPEITTEKVIKFAKGDYYFNGRKIKIPKQTDYYIFFDILFNNSDIEGFLSYEKIEKIYEKQGGVPISDKDRLIKRIQNNLTNANQGFFRNAKVDGKDLKNVIYGEKIIEPFVSDKGIRGLKLNNPDS
jgi:hypothetical protein